MKMSEKKMITKSSSKSLITIDEEKFQSMSEDNNSCTISEVIFLSGACVIMVTLTVVLYMNMGDDWSVDPETRHRVLIIALVLFCFNILLCCYMSRRLGVRICSPQLYDINSGQLYTVNLRQPLLARDLPPSYDAVAVSSINIDPPTYDEITIRRGAFDPVQVHHKATG